MLEVPLKSELQEVTDHSVYFMVPLTLRVRSALGRWGCHGAAAALGGLSAASLLQSAAIPPWFRVPAPAVGNSEDDRGRSRLAAYTASKLWIEKPSPCSEDLHPFVCRLLGGHADRISHDSARRWRWTLPDRPMRLSLSDAGRQLLNGRWGSDGPGAALDLTPSARRRLAGELEPEACPRVRLLSGDIYLWPIGFGILVLEAAYALPPGAEHRHLVSPALVAECTHNLANTGRYRRNAAGSLLWSAAEARATDEATFSLHDVMAALLGSDEPDRPKGLPRLFDDGQQRSFTYTYLQTATAVGAEAQQAALLTRLSRRYTTDYIVAHDQSVGLVRETFENVTHAVSKEGGACLVELDSGDDNHFLRDFHNTIRRVYLPFAQLVHLESITLQALTRASVVEGHFGTRMGRQALARLRALASDVAAFRLWYRFSNVAALTHQQLVYDKWRDACRIDHTMHELEGDALVAKGIIAKHQKMHVALLAVGVGVFLGVREILDFVREAVQGNATKMQVLQSEVVLNQKPVQVLVQLRHLMLADERLELGVALLVALIAVWLAYKHDFRELRSPKRAGER
jgi:hypothetical protein